MSFDPSILDWHDNAACVDADPELFYPGPYVHPSEALTLCARCPVIDECLEWALHYEGHGVWGGTSSRQRQRIRKRLGIILETPDLFDDAVAPPGATATSTPDAPDTFNGNEWGMTFDGHGELHHAVTAEELRALREGIV